MTVSVENVHAAIMRASRRFNRRFNIGTVVATWLVGTENVVVHRVGHVSERPRHSAGPCRTLPTVIARNWRNAGTVFGEIVEQVRLRKRDGSIPVNPQPRTAAVGMKDLANGCSI